MFCFIHKWLISQADISGKHLSKPVKHHIQRCSSCREYFQFCQSLKKRGPRDAAVLMADYDRASHKTIISSLAKAGGLRPRPSRTPALVPVIAAVLLVVVISISVFLLRPQQKNAVSLDQVSALVRAASPDNMLVKIESPLTNEYFALKKTLNSTTKFLVSRLDIHIGHQAP